MSDPVQARGEQPAAESMDPGRRTVKALDVPPRKKPSNYPPEFAARVAGREKRQLGDHFGLKNFGVNLTRLPPGAQSALHHRHTRQDEFIYVLEGTPTLYTDSGETILGPGECAGFPAQGEAHHLVNNSGSDVLYLEVGDRLPDDAGVYPQDDLRAEMGPDGAWRFTRKDGALY